jgi:hypothetical protein
MPIGPFADWLGALAVERGSLRAVAAMTGLHYSSVCRYAKRHGTDGKPKATISLRVVRRPPARRCAGRRDLRAGGHRGVTHPAVTEFLTVPEVAAELRGRLVYKVRWRQGGRQRAKVFNPARLGGPRKARKLADAFDVQMAQLAATGNLELLHAGTSTLAEYEQLWWERYATQRLADSTLAVYATVLDLYILPRFGHWQLRDITPAHVEDWIVALGRRGIGAPTIRKSCAVLQGILKRAVRDREITVQPGRAGRQAARPPHPHPDHRPRRNRRSDARLAPANAASSATPPSSVRPRLRRPAARERGTPAAVVGDRQAVDHPRRLQETWPAAHVPDARPARPGPRRVAPRARAPPHRPRLRLPPRPRLDRRPPVDRGGVGPLARPRVPQGRHRSRPPQDRPPPRPAQQPRQPADLGGP